MPFVTRSNVKFWHKQDAPAVLTERPFSGA